MVEAGWEVDTHQSRQGRLVRFSKYHPTQGPILSYGDDHWVIEDADDWLAAFRAIKMEVRHDNSRDHE